MPTCMHTVYLRGKQHLVGLKTCKVYRKIKREFLLKVFYMSFLWKQGLAVLLLRDTTST